MYNAMKSDGDDNIAAGTPLLVTVGADDWWHDYYDNGNQPKNVVLGVAGIIKCGLKDIHKINYTLTHHCETDEDRDWS